MTCKEIEYTYERCLITFVVWRVSALVLWDLYPSKLDQTNADTIRQYLYFEFKIIEVFPRCSSVRTMDEYIRSRWSPPGERWPLPPKQSPSTSGCENGFFLCEWLTLVIILVLLVIFLDDLELMIWTRLWFKLDNLPYLYLLRRDHDRSQTLCINTIFSGFSVWRGCDYHYKWFHIHRCNSWLHFYTM